MRGKHAEGGTAARRLGKWVDVCERRALCCAVLPFLVGGWCLIRYLFRSPGPVNARERKLGICEGMMDGHFRPAWESRDCHDGRTDRTSNTIMVAPFPVARFSKLYQKCGWRCQQSLELDPRFIKCQHCRIRGRRHVVCPRPASTNQPVETLTRNRAPSPQKQSRRETFPGYPRSRDAERKVPAIDR